MAVSKELMGAKDFMSAEFLKVGKKVDNKFALDFTWSLSDAINNAKNNVHAVGVGKKIIEGVVTDIPAITFYVAQKIPLSLLPSKFCLPKTIKDTGIVTDVVESPPAFFTPAGNSCTNDRKIRQRPIIGGISIGHKDITFGTIGYFCRSTETGDDPNKIYVLSNNHVLANADLAKLKDSIYQPGLGSGGNSSTDEAAKLFRKVKLKFGENHINKVDAAIGELLPGVEFQESICEIGKITGVRKCEDGMIVRKHGATSGLTEGIVRHETIDAVITVKMDENNSAIKAKFINQIRIDLIPPFSSFAEGGDSGSLVIGKEHNEAVGLLFAAPNNGSYGYANRIENVITELKIQLL
jgi:hypothetical protein